ncbi:protein archease [Pelomyxa schiedti]|nr:protein archease [Pelomyxa schiedti]
MAGQFEYMDHPADVIVHGWGPNLTAAFEGACCGVMNYMTPLNDSVQETQTNHVAVSGHDLENLLYTFLDEWFFLFSTEGFICKKVKITALDTTNFTIESDGVGDTFDRSRHEQGTEIKAITMHNMHLSITPSRCDVYVTVDI